MICNSSTINPPPLLPPPQILNTKMNKDVRVYAYLELLYSPRLLLQHGGSGSLLSQRKKTNVIAYSFHACADVVIRLSWNSSKVCFYPFLSFNTTPTLGPNAAPEKASAFVFFTVLEAW